MLELSEGVFRATVFVAILVLMSVLEWAALIRARRRHRFQRLLDNFLLLGLGVVFRRLVAPVAAVAAAFAAQESGIGLFNIAGAPVLLAIVLGVAMLDLAVYGQHVAMHAWTPLWYLHRVHHSDVDLDVTTGVRFHPLEILVSACFQALVVLILGVPPAAVLVFEILLNASSMLNHSNFRIQETLERVLRYVIVTPAMHWIHHSIVPHESQHNFAFCLSLWDRVFGTYWQAPGAGYGDMVLGVHGLENDARGFGKLLAQPFGVRDPAAESYVLRKSD